MATYVYIKISKEAKRRKEFLTDGMLRSRLAQYGKIYEVLVSPCYKHAIVRYIYKDNAKKLVNESKCGRDEMLADLKLSMATKD